MNDRLEIDPVRKPPTKAAYKRYSSILTEIHTDIVVIEHTLQRLGRNLKAIKDGQLYHCGGFATFQDFCQKELGQSRQQIYRLIAAHDVMQDLLVQGVPQEDLPQSERLCREIRLLPQEKQAKAWKAVMRVARDAQRPPTIVDVQTEVHKEEKAPERVQRQQKELLGKFEGVSKALKVSVAFDLLEPPFRLRLLAALAEIGESVNRLMRALKQPAVESRADDDNKGGL